LKITKTKIHNKDASWFRNTKNDNEIRWSYDGAESGRFPANFIYTGCDEVFEEFAKAGYSKTKPTMIKGHKSNGAVGKEFDSARKNDWSSNRNDDGTPARFFQDINNIEIKNKKRKMDYKLIEGDCLEVLKKLKENSVDSCVTDPPAGISFMGKDWDHDKGGRNNWIKWMTEVMGEVYRVLKPGAHCFVWSLPRQIGWTHRAIEDAGFEIRDIVTHVFGSGFPKSHNISKAIDKLKGEEREVVGNRKLIANEAKQWDGWGSATKPAWEAWILCRKPYENNYINTIQKIIENICQYLLSVNAVELILMLNQAEQKEELDSVQLSVEQKFNILEGLLEKMDTSQLKKVMISFLNIVELWNNILVENLELMNKSITSTESNMITELKILNYYLLENIPEDITKEKILNVGELLSVEIVEKNMNINLNQIEESFVVINALLNTIKKVAILTKEIEIETQKDNFVKEYPASEHWILCRKPLSEKSIAENVLRWGTGGINIDGSRIDNSDMKEPKRANEIQWDKPKHHSGGYTGGKEGAEGINKMQVYNSEGRFPSNLIHDGSEEVMEEFDKAGNRKVGWKKERGGFKNEYVGGELEKRVKQNIQYEDSEGSAARFFYCSKASTSERNEGLDELEDKEIIGRDPGQDERNVPHKKRPTPSKNNHPTVKPIKLMSYLIKMITPPGGIVLDPFLGSGSTGLAAIKSGFKFIGIEKEAEYMEIAKKRMEYNENKE